MGSELDDLIEQMKRDEYDGAEKLSPYEFAKYKGIYPQRVYRYIRLGIIETETCICGRRVVDVAAATKAIQAKEKAQGT